MRQAEVEAEKQRLVDEEKKRVKDASDAEARAKVAQDKAEASEEKAKEEHAATKQESMTIQATEKAAATAEKEKAAAEEKKEYDDISNAAQLKAAANAGSGDGKEDKSGSKGWVEYHISTTTQSEAGGAGAGSGEEGGGAASPGLPASAQEAWVLAYYAALGQGEEAAQLAARNAWFAFTASQMQEPAAASNTAHTKNHDGTSSGSDASGGSASSSSSSPSFSSGGGGSHQRWDLRKAALEKLRHRYQRSPYVCPLSSMRLTQYPDEFGAHQGALTSPDAYRRAMAKAIQAADHVSEMGGGFADPPSMAYSPALSASADLNDPEKMLETPIMQHFFSDFDGRATYAVMGTPGADLGEFILLLHSLEGAIGMPGRTSSPLADGDVYQLLSEFLLDMSTNGKSHFSLVTDEAAVQSWTDSAEVTDARHPMTPDGMSRAIATSALPGSIGSKHLRFMVENPQEYGVRKGLASAAIRAFFQIYFDSTHPSQPRLMLIVAEGKHEEKGVVVVDRTSVYPEACAKLTPLIVPNTGRQEYFVYHRAAADEFRSAMAKWIVQKQLSGGGPGGVGYHESLANRVYEDMRRVANKQFDATRRKVARGLPTYRVAFGTGV